MNIAMTAFKTFSRVLSFISTEKAAQMALQLFIQPRRFEPKEWENDAETSGQRILIDERLSALRWPALSESPRPKRALLVHGWEGRATQMSPIASKLRQQGYDVLAIDLPAHGRSPGTRTNILEFALALLAAQAQEGPFDTIIAHSMGAPATALAIHKGLKAEKLVMISAPSQMALQLPAFATTIGLSTRASIRFKDLIGEHVGVPAEEVDTGLLLWDFQKPVLVIHDKNDKEIPLAASEYTASKLANANLHITSRLGHRRILQSEDVLNLISNFTDQKSGSKEKIREAVPA